VLATQLKLDLYGRLDTAEANPIDADLPSLWSALEDTIADLPLAAKLIAAGETIQRIATIILMRSIAKIEVLESEQLLEPELPANCFAHLIRQTMVVDFSELIRSDRAIRSPNQMAEISTQIDLDNRAQLLDGAIDNEITLPNINDLLALAGQDTPAIWSTRIGEILRDEVWEFDLLMVRSRLKPVELWMGILLGEFEIERVTGGFYSKEGISISSSRLSW
jgi:hypothetical protein